MSRKGCWDSGSSSADSLEGTSLGAEFEGSGLFGRPQTELTVQVQDDHNDEEDSDAQTVFSTESPVLFSPADNMGRSILGQEDPSPTPTQCVITRKRVKSKGRTKEEIYYLYLQKADNNNNSEGAFELALVARRERRTKQVRIFSTKDAPVKGLPSVMQVCHEQVAGVEARCGRRFVFFDSSSTAAVVSYKTTPLVQSIEGLLPRSITVGFHAPDLTSSCGTESRQEAVGHDADQENQELKEIGQKQGSMQDLESARRVAKALDKQLDSHWKRVLRARDLEKKNVFLKTSMDLPCAAPTFSMFCSKQPILERGQYRLNFRGRVLQASVKNFQLVASLPEPNQHNQEQVALQFGKVAPDRFTLDFLSPFNLCSAFGIALTQFLL